MSTKPSPLENRKTVEAFRRLSERLAEVQVSTGFPMATPRRGKRLPAWTETLEGKQAFAAAAAGMSDDMDHFLRHFMISLEELEDMLVNAVLAGDHATLFHVAEAVKAAKKQEQGIFAKHIAAVLKSKRELFSTTGQNPNKTEVRERAEKILAEKGVIPYAGAERWKEIFESAKLKHLPQKRPSRGPSKQGELPKRRRPQS